MTTPEIDLDAPATIGDYDLNFTQSVGTDGALTVVATVVHAFPYPNDPRAIGDVSVHIDGERIVGSHDAVFVPTPQFTFQFTWVIPRSKIRSAGGQSELRLVFKSWELDNAMHLFRKFALPTYPHRPNNFLPVLKAGRIIRSTLGNDYIEFRDNPALIGQFKAAGINALEFSCFSSPVWWGNSQDATLADYVQFHETFVLPGFQYAVDNDMYLFPQADSFLRTPQERHWLVTTPWAPQVIQFVCQQLVTTGVCVGISTVDEADFALNLDDPETLQALNMFVFWWRQSGVYPPLSFPGQNPQQLEWWADFSSRYASTTYKGLPNQATLPSLAESFERSNYHPMSGKPLTHETSLNGPYYKKLVEGGDYQAGDEIHDFGARPQDVFADVVLALLYGACAFRSYSYDSAYWQNQRATSPVGTDGLQTGAKPGGERWAAYSEAMKMVADYEAKLLQDWRPPIRTGHLITGYRDKLKFTLNVSECSTPYKGKGVLWTYNGKMAYNGGKIPPGGVVLEGIP